MARPGRLLLALGAALCLSLRYCFVPSPGQAPKAQTAEFNPAVAASAAVPALTMLAQDAEAKYGDQRKFAAVLVPLTTLVFPAVAMGMFVLYSFQEDAFWRVVPGTKRAKELEDAWREHPLFANSKDPLDGLINPDDYEKGLEEAWERAKPAGSTVTVKDKLKQMAKQKTPLGVLEVPVCVSPKVAVPSERARLPLSGRFDPRALRPAWKKGAGCLRLPTSLQGVPYDQQFDEPSGHQQVYAQEQLTNEQAALHAEVDREKQLAAMEETADELAEGKLSAAVDHAYAMAESARVWAERAASIVDATREEQADQEAVDVATDLAKSARRVGTAMSGANRTLQYLDAARYNMELQNQMQTLDPQMEVYVLSKTGEAALKASDEVYEALQVAYRAKTLADEAISHGITSMPKLRDSDVHLAPLNEAEGADFNDNQEHSPEELTAHGKEVLKAKEKVDKMDDGEPMGYTSAGCQCDPQAKCALQGRSFTWCRVGGGSCPLLSAAARKEHPQDPALRDHNLYKSGGPETKRERDLERSGTVWDYCEPKLGLTSAGAAPRTAHGAMCAWRGDLLRRYHEDPFFLRKDGSLDVTKVPLRDRLSVEAMLQYQKDPAHQHLCTTTDDSGAFHICPTAVDDERPELAGRGWNASHSWDFCSERFTDPISGVAEAWKPPTTDRSVHEEVSEPLPPPHAPKLAERAMAPPEEVRLDDIAEEPPPLMPPVPAASAQ
ncbi:unnamed protein product, partial [Symbiodinium natans]